MLEADTGYVMTSYTSCLLFGPSEVWSSYLFKVVTPRRVIANFVVEFTSAKSFFNSYVQKNQIWN